MTHSRPCRDSPTDCPHETFLPGRLAAAQGQAPGWAQPLSSLGISPSVPPLPGAWPASPGPSPRWAPGPSPGPCTFLGHCAQWVPGLSE